MIRRLLTRCADRWHRIHMKRRAVPYLAGIPGAGAAFLPTALALLFLTIAFLFKAALFVWMRHRMTDDRRQLTIFGYALVDFFSSLTLFAGVMAGVFGVLYVFATQGKEQPGFMVTIDRAAIGGGCAIIVASGIAVAYEMRRAAGHRLSVHIEAPDGAD